MCGNSNEKSIEYDFHACSHLPISSTLKPSNVKIHILNPLCLVTFSLSFICDNLVSMGWVDIECYYSSLRIIASTLLFAPYYICSINSFPSISYNNSYGGFLKCESECCLLALVTLAASLD